MMKMKRYRSILAACALIISATATAGTSMEEGFVDPAPEYGPRTWWHWLNENVTTYGITNDLEAMKEMGYKGAHVVNLPQGGAEWTFGDDILLR